MTIAVTKKTVSMAFAQKMIERGLAHARELGKDVSLAVVDESGFLVAFARMDGANPASVQIAMDKAYTAATSRVATHEWTEILKKDEPLRMGVVGAVARMIVYGGGQPIHLEGQVIGGIGSSGAHWSGDREIGSKALELLDDGDAPHPDDMRHT